MESILWLPTISKHTTSQSARNNYVFLFYFRLFTIHHKNNWTKHNVTQRETALLIILCEGQSCDREAEKVIIKVYLTKWQSNKDRREQTKGAGKNQGKDFQLPAKTHEFFAMEMQALWNQFKHFKWWKCSTSEKICPCINMQTDIIACLIVFMEALKWV